MTPLHLVLAHVTAANRPGSHAAVLVREIERLRVENAELQKDLCNASAWLADIYRITDGELDQYLEGYDA